MRAVFSSVEYLVQFFFVCLTNGLINRTLLFNTNAYQFIFRVLKLVQYYVDMNVFKDESRVNGKKSTHKISNSTVFEDRGGERHIKQSANGKRGQRSIAARILTYSGDEFNLKIL